jgi:hypothetical protein
MVYLTQLVYLHAGREAMFREFEDVVLPLLAKHRGELLLRLRLAGESKVAGSAALPDELHIVGFETDEDLARYSNDELRRQVLHLKDESVESTLVIKGTLVAT